MSQKIAKNGLAFDFSSVFREQSHNIRVLLVKIAKTASEATEEQRRKAKARESVVNKIAACQATISSQDAEEARLADDRKKAQQKTTESNSHMRNELKKTDELQSLLNEERTSKHFSHQQTHIFPNPLSSVGIAEHDRLIKEVQDQANVLLKPYHELMGFTLQMTKSPNATLRLLFKAPNGKQCMVKVAQKDYKSKPLQKPIMET